MSYARPHRRYRAQVLAAAAVSAETVTSDGKPFLMRPNELCSVSIRPDGSWSGTVQLQRRFDGTNWSKVDNGEWTDAAAETSYLADESCELRLVVTAYSAGAADLRLGMG
jgi:hypothetical protein